MIYIIDNGQDHSDHRIYLVDVPSEKTDEIEALLDRMSAYSVIATSEEFCWREDASMSFDEFRETIAYPDIQSSDINAWMRRHGMLPGADSIFKDYIEMAHDRPNLRTWLRQTWTLDNWNPPVPDWATR